jgi:hypothetical protein
MGAIKNLILEEAGKSNQESFKFNPEGVDEELLDVRIIEGKEFVRLELMETVIKQFLSKAGWDVVDTKSFVITIPIDDGTDS